MKSNSGVKPKMKGNVIFIALLFVFIHGRSAHHSFLSKITADTLIVDGEVVEIVRDEVATNTDSLRQVMREDIVKKKKPLSATIGLHGGLAFSTIKTEHLVDGFVDVGDFTNNESSRFSFGRSFRLDASFPIYKSFGIQLGYNFCDFNYENVFFEPRELPSPDARRGFVNEDGALVLFYIVQINPGFETRSQTIPLETQKLRINSHMVPIRLTYDFKIGQETLSVRGGYVAAWEKRTSGSDYFVYIEPTQSEVFHVRNILSSEVIRNHYATAGLSLKRALTETISIAAECDYFFPVNNQFVLSTTSIRFQPIFFTIGVTKTFALRK